MAPAAFNLALPAHAEQADRTRANFQASAEAANGKKSVQPEDAALWNGLRASPKHIPCSFLYDARGTALYNQITELEEYYLYRAELDMFHKTAQDIIKHIPEGSVMVELGCGSATKTAVLERALIARDGAENCTFVGIDVSPDFLQQAKANLLEACPGLLPAKVELVQAVYLDGLRQARAMHPDEVLCVLWLGSSAGNMTPEDSLAFFKEILQISGPDTEILVCTDLWKDKAALHAAYCDSAGVTEAFIKNGFANALSVASGSALKPDLNSWTYDVVVNERDKQVEMYLIVGEALDIGNGVAFSEGERVLMEVSRKFTTEHLRGLAYNSGFFFEAQWRSRQYSIQMLCSPALAFSLAWRDTDELFARMHDWTAAPIGLRHPFCFYYGHVASFSKIKLLKGESVSSWDETFSRGIDPDVANPSKCHSHPDAPTEWPSKDKILAYVSMLRSQMTAYLRAGKAAMSSVCLSLEHERMHQETLCYMLAQQQKRLWEAAHLLPDGAVQANGASFEEEMARWEGGVLEGVSEGSVKADGAPSDCEYNKGAWVVVPAGKVVLGTALDGSSGYVWDNEGPEQAPAMVGKFKAAVRPISIAEFRNFVLSGNPYSSEALWDPEDFAVIKAAHQQCPSTWTVTGDKEVWVHYPEGTRHWQDIKERPVWCSRAEALAFCRSQGCRLMSEAEYKRADDCDATSLQLEMLQHGGWEWTSTAFGPFDGFKAMADYREYSTDFFDDKHFVLKGASPYTHPSVERPSFRNFYQGVYPHMFAKFRCCQSL